MFLFLHTLLEQRFTVFGDFFIDSCPLKEFGLRKVEEEFKSPSTFGQDENEPN